MIHLENNCFHPNNFGSVFKEIGGVDLSDEILKIFNNIEKSLVDNKEKLIDGSMSWYELIEPFLREYIHNRVGTPIRDLEVGYIRKDDVRPRPFKRGELIIYEENIRRLILFYH